MNFKVLRLPPEGRLFAVGDVHGHFNLLEDQLSFFNFDEEVDVLVSVGDLVDRGPDSHKAVEWVNKPWFHAVRGNHEEMLLPETAGCPWHVINGGGWFNTMVDMDGLSAAQTFAEVLTDLPLAMEVHKDGRKFGFVHAAFPALKRDSEVFLTDWNDAEELADKTDWFMDENQLLWDRSQVRRALGLKDKLKNCPELVSERKMREFNVANVDHVYFGHTPLKEPLHVGNCSWLDTGAFATGNLTVVQVA